MYENNTYETIRKRMLEYMFETIDKREGSFTSNMVSPIAAEFAKVYIEFDNILNMAFLETGYDNFLDMKVSEFGIDRKMGDKASGIVTFYGTKGTIVNEGTIVTSTQGLNFKTTVTAIVASNGSIEIPVEAEEIGVEYNVESGSITTLKTAIYGITHINNTDEISGGLDIELDEDLKRRFKETIRKPATSGNVYDYEQWATSVDGVGFAKVEPLWDGPGTVRIIITDIKNKPVTEEVKTQCKAYIDSVRPIGATVTVDTPIAFNITLNAKVELEDNYDIEYVKDIFSDSLLQYLSNNSFTEVTYTKIASILSNTTGVKDFTNLTLNSKSSNIKLPLGTVPEISTITLTEGEVE